MTRAVARERLDVFFSPWGYTYFPLPPSLAAVSTFHDAIVDRFPKLTLPSHRARLFWRLKVKMAIAQSRIVLTVSDYAAAQVSKTLGVRRDRIPWIGLDDDRENAQRLEEQSRGASLEAMVHAYWAMTPGTSTHHAARFVQHVMTAHERSREWLDRLGETNPSPPGGWLDVGTGTGDLACTVAAQGIQAVGVDIAMRWRVVVPS